MGVQAGVLNPITIISFLVLNDLVTITVVTSFQ